MSSEPKNTPHSLLLRLERLRNKAGDEDDVIWLNSSQDAVAQYEAFLALKDNVVIINRIRAIEEELKSIEAKLLDRHTSESDRQYFFAKQDVLKEDLRIFTTDLGQAVYNIEQELEDAESRIK